jgi:hypothetical protein
LKSVAGVKSIQGMPNKALQQTRDSVLRYREPVGREVLNLVVGRIRICSVTMKHLPQLPRIRSSDLSRLTLDLASAHRFDGQFLPALFGGIFLGVASLFFGYLLYRTGTLTPDLGCAVGAAGMLPGLAIAFITHRRMLHATPLCIQSGQQMHPFVVEDHEQDDCIEIAYIDQKSGRYFTKSYVA